MKRIFLSTITLLFLATIAKADGLVVADVGIQPGKTATVQVALNSSGETYRAVLFSLTLPTGVNVTADEYGEPVTAADEQLTAAGYNVTANHLADGSYRFAVVNTGGNTVIPAECGPLFSFTIEADASLTSGDVLTGTLSEIKLTDAYAEDHQAENVTFNITVEETRTILNETSETAPAASDGAVNVRVLRTINANEWSTICLPFAMTAEQIETAFGSDVTVELADADSYETTEDDDDNIVEINVYFNTVQAIEANHPYIIRVSSAITSFDVDGVVVSPATAEKDRRKQIGQRSYFVGNYVNQKEVPEFGLFLNGNKFWYSVGDTKMKAFRAYFSLKDVLTEVDEAAARISFSFDDSEATGIAENEKTMVSTNRLRNGENEKRMYDLQGRRISASLNDKGKMINDKVNKGIYIVNGKMVVR